MSELLEQLRKRVLIYDCAMGTILQELGLKAGECPEILNLSNPADADLLSRARERERIAEALLESIYGYFGENPAHIASSTAAR